MFIKYLWIRVSLLGVSLLTISVSDVVAQFQRMAIPTGAYSVPAGGTSRLSAYCMDFTRKAPRPGVAYGHVLKGGPTTRIRIGDNIMSAEDAVQRGLVAFEGYRLTADDLIEGLRDPAVRIRIPEELKTQADAVLHIWDAASAEERSQLRTMLTPIAEEQTEGDFASLTIRNTTDQAVTLEVGETLLIGAEAEPTSDLPEKLIPDSKNPQADWWRDRNMVHQQVLQELGYYSGSIDGDFGKGSRAALESFQDAFHIDERDGIGQRTQSALDAALTRTRALRKLNQVAGHDVSVFRLERFPESDPGVLFTLYDVEGRPIARTNDVGELLQVIGGNQHVQEVNSVYLDAPGFTESEVEGLRTSLVLRQGDSSAELRVRPLHYNGPSGEGEPPLFAPGVELTRISDISAAADRPGFNRADLVFSGPRGQSRLHVFARAREVLQAFLDRIASAFIRPGRVERSPADLINDAIRSLRRSRGDLKDEDLRLEFEDQLGGIQIVMDLPLLEHNAEIAVG